MRRKQTESQKIARAKLCGCPMAKTNVKGKIISKYVYICNQPRYCKNCAKNRAEKFRDRADRAYISAGGKLVIVVVSSEEAARLTKGVDKSLYLKDPFGDGQVLLLARSDCENFAHIKSDMGIDDIDWSLVSATTTGKRPSGTLGRKEKVATTDINEKEETFSITALNVVCDFSGVEDIEQVKHDAVQEAMWKTGYLAPKWYASQLETAMNRRTVVYANALKRHGVGITKIWQRETIKKSLYEAWNKKYKLSFLEYVTRSAKQLGIALTGLPFELWKITIAGEMAAMPT